jgi:hypothetical protein
MRSVSLSFYTLFTSGRSEGSAAISTALFLHPVRLGKYSGTTDTEEKVNRREFSKLCASTVITGLVPHRSVLPAQVTKQGSMKAGSDGYIRREGMTWIMGTSKVEQRVSLEGGRFGLTSFSNKIAAREYKTGGSDPDQVRLTVNGMDTTSPAWHWTFVAEETQQLSQGELQLNIRLKGGVVEVTKHWMIYPHTAIIREWITVENISDQSIRLENPFFLNTRVLGAAVDNVELAYVSGGGNYNGSQLLKTEHMRQGYSRTLDSHIGVQTGNYSAYLPFLLLRQIPVNDCMLVGWDYMGHWVLQVGDPTGEQIDVSLNVAGYDATLQSHEQIETPKAFTAALSGELDEIGNQILDWQYQYFWEFTNPEYFGKTRWAVDWPDPWVGDGGTPSSDNWGRRLALDLRYTDLLRESGGDILWDDAGWYDSWGNWNGPDWRLATTYLRKHGMRWVLWLPSFLTTPESEVAQQHPEWRIPGQMAFEQSIPDTRIWQKKLLDKGVKEWQDFQWRYDIAPAAAANDTKLLASDQQFRKLLEEFKVSHPNSGIDACDGGGRWISYDLARFAESGEYTDGGVGPYSAYFTSLLISPDKLHNVSDFDHTYYNASCDRTHLALNPTWYRDPGDGADVENIRKDWELYHYFLACGVAGRWSHVFRPKVSGDDPIWYFQRMNPDGSSGVIITKHAKTGSGYFLVSKPVANASGDHFEGGPTQMAQVFTTDVATPDTGIYSDPIDQEFRYYGVPGECYGPLNFRYATHEGEQSYVTRIVKPGVSNPVGTQFFGMAFQAGGEALTVTELGQFDPGNNRGVYLISLVRETDRTVLGSVTLDMSRAPIDSHGFKYAKLDKPVLLEPGLDKPITIYPRGLQPDLVYLVDTYHSKVHLQQSGKLLMTNGVQFPRVLPGELIFLNLPDYPGSGTAKPTPRPPSDVTKRVGTNIGAQGIEVAWSAAVSREWISYYEVWKDNRPIGRSAKGTFFFDHSPGARYDIAAKYEVRAVDGNGNHSPLVEAHPIPDDPEIHEPLGEFWPTQGRDGWSYEQSSDGITYQELTWRTGGYEGFWAGSGLGRVGRLWMQPSAATEIARTFVVPRDSSGSISGNVQKDPSAESSFAVFVRIDHNGKQIWPDFGWATVPMFSRPMPYAIKNRALHKGDAIRFVVRRNDKQRAEPIIWDPIIVLEKRF